MHDPVATNPGRTAITLVAIIFGTEMAIMALFSLTGAGTLMPKWMYDSSDAVLLSIVASLAIYYLVLLPQRSMLSHAKRLNRLLRFLSYVNQVVQRQRDEQALFDAACHGAVKVGCFVTSAVSLLNRDTGMAELQACAGMDEPADTSIPPGKAGSYCEAHNNAIRDGKPYTCNNIEESACKDFCRNVLQRHGAHSTASFPLFRNHEAAGVFTVYAREVDYFKDDELDVLKEAADDISLALDVIDADKRLEQRLDELERFARATVDREFRIKELRDEVAALRAQLPPNQQSPDAGMKKGKPS